jgi:hypothetical protein
MGMGKPEDEAKRAKFAWTPRKTHSIADSGNSPFDWTAAPLTAVSPTAVEVLCAVDTIGKGDLASTTTPMGTFDSPATVITLLDTAYVQIFDDDDIRADTVIIDGNTYDIEFEVPPMGLFEVTVHQFVLKARDES